MTTGGALTSTKAAPQKDLGATAVDEPEPEKETEVVKPAESEPVGKKSFAVPEPQPTERAFRRVPTPKPTAEVRSVGRLAAKVAAAAEPAQTIVQRTAAAVEQTPFKTLAAAGAIQDAVPVMTAAIAAPVERPTLPRLLTNLVSAFGFGALAGNTPGAPIGTPIVMALLALGVQRESRESVSTLSKTAAVGNSPVAALALTGDADRRGRCAVRPQHFLRRYTGGRQPEHIDYHEGHRSGRSQQHADPLRRRGH